MSDELERMWKEKVMSNLRILSLNLPVGAVEYHEERKKGLSVSGLKLETGPYRSFIASCNLLGGVYRNNWLGQIQRMGKRQNTEIYEYPTVQIVRTKTTLQISEETQ
jgi:hypothetical protein